MKKFSLILAVVLFLFSGLVSVQASEAVVIVNGEEVPAEEYEKRLERLKYHVANLMEIDFSTPEGQEWLQVIESRVMEELIWETIFMQEVEEDGLEVSSEEVEEAFAEYKQEYASQEEFDNFLEEAGFTEEEYRELIHTNLLIEKLLEMQVGEFSVTEEELKEYYENNIGQYSSGEQVAARHLLYDEEERAQEVLEAIEAGDDFADYMEDGEELGYFGRGMMVPEFEETAFDMEVGEIKGPVQTHFGFHIIYVYDREEETVSSFEEVRDQIEEDLYEEHYEKQVNAYFQKLYEESEVEFGEEEMGD